MDSAKRYLRPVFALAGVIALAIGLGAQEQDASPPAKPSVSKRPLHELVATGREKFDAGDYAGAQESFAAAELKAPEDLRVAYDRGRTYHAAGDAENARTFYDRVAGSGDIGLAVRALYNLGNLSVASARGRLGEDPVALPKDQRQPVVDDLEGAIARYRGVLELAPSDRDARRNIELIRLWITDMEDRWRRADREKARNEADLVQYLDALIKQQAALELATRFIEAGVDENGKPVRLAEVSIGQTELRDEIPHVEAKVRDHLQKIVEMVQSGAAPGAPPPQPGQPAKELDPKIKEQLDALEKRLLDGASAAGVSMATAVNKIDALELEPATASQRDARFELEKMWQQVASFMPLLDGAIEREAAIAGGTTKLADDETEIAPEARTKAVTEARDAQGRVRGLVPFLENGARGMIRQLEAQVKAAGESGQAPPPPQPGQQDPAKMLEAFEQAEKRLPEADAAMKATEEALQNGRAKDAATKSAEAEKILREIRDLFKSDDQQQDQEQDKDKQQQDQQQQQEQDKSDQKKGDGEKDPKSAGPKERQKQLDRDAASRALERMREARNKREKQRSAVRAARRPVERDW